MPSPFNFIGLLAVISSLVGSAAAYSCRMEGTILNCSASNENAIINTVIQTTNNLSETRIFYNGTVTLELIAPNSNAIVIQAVDPAGSSSLQIRRLETNASRIDVKIILSPGQVSTPLFSASSAFNLSRTTVAITIKQLTTNIDNFRIFQSPSTANKVIRDYQIIFDKSSTVTSGVSTLFPHRLSDENCLYLLYLSNCYYKILSMVCHKFRLLRSPATITRWSRAHRRHRIHVLRTWHWRVCLWAAKFWICSPTWVPWQSKNVDTVV